MKNPRSLALCSPVRPLFTAMLLGLFLSPVMPGGMLGCNSNQIGGGNGSGNDDGGTGGGTDDGGTGGTDDSGGQSAYCMGKGPPIVVGDSAGGTSRCSGQVAASAFRYGMCLCQGLSSGSAITVDAFDSTQPGLAIAGTGGSVGVNSNVNVSSTLSVGGSLQIIGTINANDLTVGTDALVSDTLSVEKITNIKRNAQIGGDVKSNGTLKVVGNLNYPANRMLTAPVQMIGSTTRNPVSIATPCDCAAGNIFNIASYVEERRASNDNASIGLSASQLTNFSGDQTLNLSCGRFFLDRIGGNGKLNINVSGRSALFIGGDVNLANAFTITLGASGELDLFINGGLTSSAPLTFGNKDAPARVRLYMGGARNINLAGGTVFGGNLYAPESALVTSGTLEVFGAVFVRSFNPSAAVQIHHDIAILNAAQDCGSPGTGGTGGTGGTTSQCKRCQDCGGQACNGGTCGGCTVDGDCCTLLVCRNKKCVYEAG